MASGTPSVATPVSRTPSPRRPTQQWCAEFTWICAAPPTQRKSSDPSSTFTGCAGVVRMPVWRHCVMPSGAPRLGTSMQSVPPQTTFRSWVPRHVVKSGLSAASTRLTSANSKASRSGQRSLGS